MKFNYITLFILLINAKCFAQNYHINTFTRSNGLSQNQILALYQDSKDYLWIATGNGISRFDGKRMISFNNSSLLNSEPIYTFFEEKNRVWIYNNQKIISLDIMNEKVHMSLEYDSINLESYAMSLVKLDDVFFIGTLDKGLYTLKNNELISHEINNKFPNSTISKIVVNNNYIWLSIRDKALVKLHLNGKIYKVFDSNSFHNIRDFQIIDDQNVIINNENRLEFFNEDENDFSELINLYTINKNLELYSFKYYRNVFYIATNIGLVISENDKNELVTVENGLLTNSVTSILIDREENIWIGSDSYGLNQIISPNIRNYSKVNGLTNPSINVIKDFKDSLLIGTDEGIYTLKNKKVIKDEKFLNFNKDVIWDIEKDLDNHILISTERGLFNFSILNNKTIKLNLPKNVIVLKIFNFNRDINLLCTTNGLFIKNRDLISSLAHENKENLGRVWDIIEFNSRFIIGSDKGLFYLDKDDLSKIKTLNGSVKDISSLYKIEDNHFYFSSKDGLFEFNKNKITHFEKLNFNGNTITTIFKNTNDNIWVAHEDGLELFDGQNIIEHMDINDGFSGSEITTNNAVLNKSGIFYLGFYGGLSEFKYVNQLKIIQPNIYITNAYSAYDTLKINLHENMQIIPSNFKRVYFEFNSPWLKSSNDISYIYYLEGLESKWANTTNQNNVNYSNLEYGEYTFHVKSINHNKIESQNNAKISFILERPIWYNPFYIAVIIILFIFLSYWAFKLNMSRLNKKNIALEKRVRLRTKELVKAKEYIEQIVEFAAIVIVTVDIKGQIVSWNKQGEFVFGYLKREIIGKNIKILDLVNDRFSFKDIFLKIDNESFVSEIEITKQKANGSKVFLLFSASLIFDSNNEKTGYTLIFNDISQQKELQEKKAIHQKMIGGIDALNQLLGTMSHHINNSVASILSIIQLNEETNKFEDKVIEITKEHTNKINAVISSLKVLVLNLNLKTKNYAGRDNQVFDIDEDIKEFNRKFEKLSRKKDHDND